MNKLTKIILTFLLLVTVAMGYSTVAMAAEANSMIYYFNSSDGRPVTSHKISGEALVKQGLAIKKVDVPTDVESWRLSLDLNTNAGCCVFAEGKDEEGALAQKKTEDEAEALAGKEKNKADEKAEADRQAAEANSMIYYFNSSDGRPVTSHKISGEALVKQGLAIKKVDVPTDVESWRLSLDLNTNAVVVFAEGKDEEGALAQKKTEDEAEALAGKEKNKADEKAEADRQAANEEESARNATRQAAEAEQKTAYANSEAGREEQSVRDAESARNATRQAAEAEQKTAYANSEAGREEQSVRDAESARNATRQAAEAEQKTAYANSEAGREEQSVRDAESARNATRQAAEAEQKTAESNAAEANSESNAAESNTAESNSESNAAESNSESNAAEANSESNTAESNTAEANSESNAAETEAASIAE